jgi:uncharacterized protein
MKIAVIGGGIAGLAAARNLSRFADVTLYEAERRLGGHANTVDVTVDDQRFAVDTGFLVFNERTYPKLIRLFSDLAIPTAPSEMSFAVSVPLAGGRHLEWAGTNLATVFAQRRNLLSPRFVGMLADLLRFNREATAIAQLPSAETSVTLGDFLDRNRYGVAFRRWYLLPMAAAIWSCPVRTMLDYPLATFARFCHNHGLLQVNDRPKWHTVAGGARQYVDSIAADLGAIRLGDPVRRVTRENGSRQVLVTSDAGIARYDEVVLACHSDQSLALLADADDAERNLLASVRYQRNRALLHTDTRLMPRARSVWSSWNYLSDGGDEPQVAVTYLLNKLQPLPTKTPLLLSLNPLLEPRPETLLGEFDYAHPVFDRAAIAAQQMLPEFQGSRQVWFAGAWTGYGFHEDGLSSGLAVAAAIRALRGGTLLAA